MSLDVYLMYGSTTVQLANGTLSYVTGYDAGIPTKDQSGNVTVTDQLRLRLIGTTATLQTTIASINQMIDKIAERREKPFLQRVFIVRSVDTVYWRSELVDARLILSNESLDQLGRKPEVQLIIQRVNYWENITLTELPLTNGSGSNVLGGITVYPWDDAVAGRDNWVTVAGAAVTGDLEAPVRLELENTYNSASRTGDVYLGNNWNSSPANLAAVLEGEAGTGGSILPASPDTALYSGGQYKSITVPLTEASTPLYWTLDSANLGYYGGNDFTVLLRLTGNVQADTWAKIKVKIGLLVTLFETPAVLLPTGSGTSTLYSLGRIQLPPYLVNSGVALGSLTLSLHLWRAAGTYTQGVDYIQLMPMDSFRKIENLGWDLEYGETLIDDGIEGNTYAVWGPGFGTSAGAYGYHIPYGEVLRVKPGVAQKIHVVVTGATPGARTSKVKLYYRPRRQSL